MFDKQELARLIQYIAFEVQDRGIPLLRTRLVKLLYLLELEFYRTRRQRLSDLRWIRYRYGPFSFDLDEVTARLGFQLEEEEVDFRTGQGIRYEVHEPRDVDDWLPFRVKTLADAIITRWADEDLETLLDYVYLQTEPMGHAEFGEELDFSKTDRERRPSLTTEIKLSDDELQRIRDLQDKYEHVASQGPIPDEYEDLAAALERIEGGFDSTKLSGRATFDDEDDDVSWKESE